MDLSERTGSDARHPWEVTRAAFLLDRIEASLAPGLRVLDTGSGDAWLAQQLLRRAACDVTCWDVNYRDDDLVELQRPGLTPTRTAPTGPFDVALLLDVIEHVDDDLALVNDVVGRVRPGGLVLVSVPAWPQLFSAHDRALRHLRRYTPDSCRTVLRQAGLTVLESGGFFHALLLPRAASLVVEKTVEKLRGAQPDVAFDGAGVGGWRHGPLVTTTISGVLRLEQRASRALAGAGIDLPGLSFYALCRVPLSGRVAAQNAPGAPSVSPP